MKYLCYYDTDNKEGRSYCLAATNKIDYISKAIVSTGESVEIVSASITSSSGHFHGSSMALSDNIVLTKFSTCKWGNIIQKLWALMYGFFVLFFYLLFHTKQNEKIIVYHSLGYMRSISLAKFFKRFRLIIEVEEIYGDVSGNKREKKREFSFFKKADAYIFPTELLNKKINFKQKPYIIIHGTYNAEQEIGEKHNDGKIHCVYAGTFDPRKGGVYAAVGAGLYLDERYHLHIIGFGGEDDKKQLIDIINDVSKKTNCKVTYDGLLSGEEYLKFIQSCDIGLSTQNPNAQFNNTSFPSKVLSYLANGLRVVSVKIDAVEYSSVGDMLYYYKKQAPKDIAEAIKSVDMNVEYNSRKKIMELDEQFRREISKVLE